MVYVARTGLEVPRPDILETSTTRSASREMQPSHHRRPRSAPITTNFVSILTRLQCTQTVVRTTIGHLEKCVAPWPMAMRSLPSEGGQRRWPRRKKPLLTNDRSQRSEFWSRCAVDRLSLSDRLRRVNMHSIPARQPLVLRGSQGQALGPAPETGRR